VAITASQGGITGYRIGEDQSGGNGTITHQAMWPTGGSCVKAYMEWLCWWRPKASSDCRLQCFNTRDDDDVTVGIGGERGERRFDLDRDRDRHGDRFR
jgi:hypothetical protein